MKIPTALTSGVVLAMVSCESMNGPGSGGGFDPLQTPGSQFATADIDGPQPIRPGEFVTAVIENTAFYNQRPGAEAEADKLLSRGTSMKVISTSGSFYRVELDTGEVGFVPSVMVEAPGTMSDDSDAPFELYPDGFEPEPVEPLPEDMPTDIVPDVIEPVLEPQLDTEPPEAQPDAEVLDPQPDAGVPPTPDI